jgi:hypothetical protein
MLAVAGAASAAVVVEDFAYTPDNATLRGQSGGSGWTGVWGTSTSAAQNTGTILIDSDVNLAYATGGYNVTQTGTGLAYGTNSAFRGINRYVDTNLTGTIWFSLLVRNAATGDRAGINLNHHHDLPASAASDFTQGAFDIGLFGTDLIVRYNSVNSSSLATLTLNSTHLILGQIVLNSSGVNDTLRVWADPADLGALGTPLFDVTTANLGVDLYMLGVYAWGAAGTQRGNVDALRASDDLDAFQDVTGYIEVVEVPAPSGIASIAALSAGLIARRRRAV